MTIKTFSVRPLRCHLASHHLFSDQLSRPRRHSRSRRARQTFSAHRSSLPVQLLLGLALFLSSCSTTHTPGPLAHQSSALRLQTEGKYDEAIPIWEKVIAENPQDHVAPYNLALIYNERGDLVRARSLYEQSLLINPKNADAHTNLALVLLAQKELDSGLSHAKLATELAPQYPHFWYNLGLLHHHRREFSQSKENYQRAVDADPKFALAWYNLGKVDSAESDLVHAMADYQKALDANPKFWEANYNLARIYHRLGNFPQAMKFYNSSLELKPDHPDTLANIQQVKEFLAKQQEFHIRLSGSKAPAIEQAWEYHQNGLLSDAEENYLKAAKENPKDLRAAGNLCHVYLLQTRYADAIAAYKEALSKDPKNGALAQGLAAAERAKRDRELAPI